MYTYTAIIANKIIKKNMIYEDFVEEKDLYMVSLKMCNPHQR
jgi:hypothetical protein